MKSANLTSISFISCVYRCRHRYYQVYIFTFIFRDNTNGDDCYLSEQVWLRKPFHDQLFFPHCTHIKTILWLAAVVLFAETTAICDFIF